MKLLVNKPEKIEGWDFERENQPEKARRLGIRPKADSRGPANQPPHGDFKRGDEG